MRSLIVTDKRGVAWAGELTSFRSSHSLGLCPLDRNGRGQLLITWAAIMKPCRHTSSIG